MKQIVIISGKGGTGKTSITAALAGAGPHKVLADCDVDAADLHLILSPEINLKEKFHSGFTATIDLDKCIQCGQCREHCRFDAISPEFTVIREKCEGCGACEFVCPSEAATMQDRMCGYQFVSNTRFGTMVHAALGIGEENSGKLVTSVRREAKAIAEAEKAKFVLVDGSPGIGCPVIASLADIDICILVAEPTVSAIHDLKRVHELAGHFKTPCMCILNKCGINPALEQELEQYCAANSIVLLGKFQYDLDFTKAQLHRQTVVEYDPEKFGPIIDGIWNEINQYFRQMEE
ncbi:ATP-binding protein [Salidesulfovibrio onnuriiensis]|uniref:ATP-binding protein n=1 Tax=Salidesulfovibrio onnuriiensis TaxID=2583823 RepID=UPI0011C7E240|nr:ATP-binding protein [Salidesulfovibrio onnuriiensis]